MKPLFALTLLLLSACATRPLVNPFPPVENAVLPGVLEFERHPDMEYSGGPHSGVSCDDTEAHCPNPTNDVEYCERLRGYNNGSADELRQGLSSNTAKQKLRDVFSYYNGQAQSVGWVLSEEIPSVTKGYVWEDKAGRLSNLHILRKPVYDIPGLGRYARICFVVSGSKRAMVVRQMKKQWDEKLRRESAGSE